METLSALLAICAGNSPVSGEFPAQRPVTRSFDIFFDLRLNKRLSKQPWGWWFKTLSCPLWRQCNVKWISRIWIGAKCLHKISAMSSITVYVLGPSLSVSGIVAEESTVCTCRYHFPLRQCEPGRSLYMTSFHTVSDEIYGVGPGLTYCGLNKLAAI